MLFFSDTNLSIFVILQPIYKHRQHLKTSVFPNYEMTTNSQELLEESDMKVEVVKNVVGDLFQDDLHPNWKLTSKADPLSSKLTMSSSSANDENEDQQPLPLETKLFSDSGSTWPFKARRRSSNDSRLLLLGGKLKKRKE